jgi:hypothetical protein
MATHRTALVRVICTVLLFVSSTAYGISIDGYVDPFPSNPDLPGSNQPILFVGTMYDPLDSYVSHLISDVCSQSGLSSVLGGDRHVELTYVSGTASAMVLNGLWLNNGAGARSVLEIHYGMTTNLDADLTVYAGTQLEIEVIDGDMSAGPRPIPCTVTVTSHRGTPQEATASVTQDLIDTDTYEYPFTSFGGVDFRHVDEMVVVFDASQVTAVDIAIGSFETNGDPVPVAPTTWGHIKSLWE